jgi:anthranilate synthase component 2
MSQTHIFLLDNVDSFTYNLVDELRRLGYRLTIYRNTVSADYIFQQIQQAQQQGQLPLLMLSPGPGTPQQAGCMLELIALCQDKFAVLGICLGHQAIAVHYGADIVRAAEVVHGKASLLTHTQSELFANLPQSMPIARYHSLVATHLPDGLQVIAKVDDMPMAILQSEDRMLGFQFHPESILTSQGSQLLKQSIDYLIAQ